MTRSLRCHPWLTVSDQTTIQNKAKGEVGGVYLQGREAAIGSPCQGQRGRQQRVPVKVQALQQGEAGIPSPFHRQRPCETVVGQSPTASHKELN